MFINYVSILNNLTYFKYITYFFFFNNNFKTNQLLKLFKIVLL